MQRQLEFWPTIKNNPKRSPVWEKLTAEERVNLIVVLARLIRKTVLPETNNPIQENPHEQS